MSYKEVVIDGIKLRCYEDGIIERYFEKNYKKYKKGWNIYNQSLRKDGYFEISINYKHYKSHRIISFAYLELDIKNKDIQIDHINGNRQDNRICNLRLLSNQKNSFNRNCLGYFKNKYGTFTSSIGIDYQVLFLGNFKTEEEARQAYLEAKIIYHKI